MNKFSSFLRKALCLTTIGCFPVCLMAQQNSENQNNTAEIDPSKPSNLYSSLAVSGERQHAAGNVNTWGTRIYGSFAPSERQLLQVELPLLYNAFSKKFGIGDIRGRYFGLIKKNDKQVFNSFGGSLDVFFPSGSREKGLGSGSWIIAPGILAGITVSPKVLLYPIVSFVHVTKPDFKSAKATNGSSIEVISVFDLGSAAWLQFTPKFSINDFKNRDNSNLNFRLNLGKMIKEDLSISGEVLVEVKNKMGLQNCVQVSVAKFFN